MARIIGPRRAITLAPRKGGGVIRTLTIMRDALVLRDTQRLTDNG
ncbi:hypothetical protein J2X45_003949 [Caulobacter sp. BE264]|nr:hypothetical protein [Caulobacter sp. BE264]MDR7232839.1 hypothetical protein [Caulobacter sp. BE264]